MHLNNPMKRYYDRVYFFKTMKISLMTCFQSRLASCVFLFFTVVLPANALVLRVYNPTAHLRMNGFPATPTINPTFLNPSGAVSSLLDLTGVGWSVEDTTKQFTLVSPRHFVGANHFRPAVGSTVRFLAKDHSLHTFTIAALSTIPNADASPSDVFLGELTGEVPASVAVLPLPYLNLATEAAYTGQSLIIAGKAARGGRGTIGSVSDFGGDPITSGAGIKTRAFTFSYGSIGSADDAHAEVGDSGSPSLVNRSGMAALVGTHTAVLNALGTTTTYDTLVPHYAPEFNARMEATGLHLRKSDPPATSFSATGMATTAIIRTGQAFTCRVSITNESALADNISASLTPPAGSSISGISAAGWYLTGATSLRRGGLAAGETVEFDVTFPSAPNPGIIQISLNLKSDGSVPQAFQFPITILPSFAGWAAGLQDQSLTGDSDQDGISNLIEYASGGDNLTNSQTFPSGEMDDPLLPIFFNNPMRLLFHRRTDASMRGLTYLVETSPTLAATSWQLLDSVPISVRSSPAIGFEKVEAVLPTTPFLKAFYRLRIELAE